MVAPIGIVVRPHRTLAAVAGRPRLATGAAAVVATGLLSLLLELAAVTVEPHRSRAAAVATSLSIPLLFLGFWGLGGWLIGAGARAMGAPRRRRQFLAVSGITFPVLVLYAAISLAQAVALRWGGDAGSGLSDLLGLTALPLLGWFIGLTAVAVISVYEVSPMSAIALALLPYAALAAAVLVLILTASVLRLVA